jgi:LuxR family maltose regulon positive regulatory protein
VWFEEQARYAEAIPHWLAVPNPSEAARLIGRLAPDLIKNGELQTLLGWLNRLPASVVDGDADLITYKVLSLLMTGEIRPAREYAAQAAATFGRESSETGHGRLLSMQAWLASTAGEPQNAQLAQAALDQLDEDDLFFRALATISLGTAYGWGGELAASTEAFRETWLLGRQMNHPFIALGALANLAFNLLDMGELREGESLCRAAFDAYVDSRGHRLPILGIIYAPLAAICYEQADFEEAEALAEAGIELTERLFSNTIMGGDNEVTLARIALERGRPGEAIDQLQAAAESARQRGMAIVVHKMAIAQAELYLLMDRLAAADLKLRELETETQSDRAKSGRLVKHLRARHLIASDDPQGALAILESLEQSARDGGGLRWLMSVRLSQAMAYRKQGDLDKARDTFEGAVRLAAPEGYRSLFLPHAGRPTRALLHAARPVAPHFVDDILKIAGPAEEGFSPVAAQLPEPLTDQEQRVLGLIVEGKTNREIAEELVITVGTAKWHVHNVLQKLDVNNRAQAIVRAHELGIA